MSMKSLRKFGAAGIGTGLFLSQIIAPVYANSAQRYWTGTDSNGLLILDENCPIVVEHEQLTLNIGAFPDPFNFNHREFEENSSVTAEYTFFNPADYTVEATLVFPFGTKPDYMPYGDPKESSDISAYRILSDGGTVDTRLRHTLSLWGTDFDLTSDIAKLRNGYTEDVFYQPEMTVTRFIYQIEDADLSSHSAAAVSFVYKGNGTNTKVLFENQSGFDALNDGGASFRLGKTQ